MKQKKCQYCGEEDQTKFAKAETITCRACRKDLNKKKKKECVYCGETDSSKFSPNDRKTCHSCRNKLRTDPQREASKRQQKEAYARKKEEGTLWYQRNPEKAREISDNYKKKIGFVGETGREYNNYKIGHLKRTYGVSVEEYDLMLEEQDCKCKVCKAPLDGRNSHLDHCHITGKVCSILCVNCNTAIGNLREDPELIQKALDYVKQYKKPKV